MASKIKEQHEEPAHLWPHATPQERAKLASVYELLLAATDPQLRKHVQFALFIEILEDDTRNIDYKRWPKEFLLSGKIWRWQAIVAKITEAFELDCVQRANYMKLAMGKGERHKDIAYGLSEKLMWKDKDNVVKNLLDMGKREYKGAIPVSHEKENNVLHVAVSYKHTSKHDEAGTINAIQADAIWKAVRAIPYVKESTEIRVWVDQNIHRTPIAEKDWHEVGLAPYACLKVVFVGYGDFSLRPAFKRPWLWVEMITALKGDGFHTVPGHEAVEDCDNLIETLGGYQTYRDRMTANGWIVGPGVDIDKVMAEVAFYVSLWRKSFLGHSDYEEEYLVYFADFVNWARLFVIRGVQYSEMTWNHRSDEPLRGLDAVALIRAMPRNILWITENQLGILRPILSWACISAQEWVLGDIIDRTEIDTLLLSSIVECAENASNEFQEICISGSHSIEHIRFRKQSNLVTFFFDGSRAITSVKFGRATQVADAFLDRVKSASSVTTMRSAEEDDILNYIPFTLRTSLSLQNIQFGNISLSAMNVSESIAEALHLKKIGICYNTGLCESVYETNRNGHNLRLSTMEIKILLSTAKGDFPRMLDMATAMKKHHAYKSLLHRDLSQEQKRNLCDGWIVEALELYNKNYLSGEGLNDVERELVSLLKARAEHCTLVHVTELNKEKVMVNVKSRKSTKTFVTTPFHAQKEIAAIETNDIEKLCNREVTGLIQMAIGMRPSIPVKPYGASLNPRLLQFALDNGQELDMRMVRGLFVKCNRCNNVVCQLNGLRAELVMRGGAYNLTWGDAHNCSVQEYTYLYVQDGARIV